MVSSIRTISLLLLLFCQAVAASAVRIEMMESSELKFLHYRLGDVSRIEVEDSELKRQLAGVRLGKAPRPGYVSHITKQQVDAVIRRNYPGLSRSIEWLGPDVTKLTSLGKELPGRKIVDVAQEYLERKLRQRYSTIYVSTEDYITSMIVPMGDVRLAANLPRDYRLSRRMAVWVDVNVDGDDYQTVPVWFDVSVFEEALVANKALEKNSSLKEGDFSRLVVDIAVIGGEPVTEVESLAGMRLSSPIEESTVLISDVLEITPLIAKGQKVTVYTSSGKVSLSTTAIALHDGKLLQKVSVQNPKYNTHYTATVIGQGMVKVD